MLLSPRKLKSNAGNDIMTKKERNMKGIKDLRMCKKILAILAAGMLSLSLLPALAESETENKANESSVALVNGEETNQITIDEYLKNVDEIIEYTEPFIGRSYEMLFYIQTVYYYENYRFCREIRQDLMDMQLISEDPDDDGNAIVNFTFRILSSNKLLDGYLWV